MDYSVKVLYIAFSTFHKNVSVDVSGREDELNLRLVMIYSILDLKILPIEWREIVIVSLLLPLFLFDS